ncbi:MAG TPA: glycoside hydrolase domain-containing protein [Candidatus Aquilonibacter sp.]|nr:glycoside hydrolase domain-containing protein [Candidatus Aquilonibacter sp.]
MAKLAPEFAFTGYWLNGPPGETATNWTGKRAVIQSDGFGFVILFNGRLDKQLKSVARATILGEGDADSAVSAALREGFPKGAIIFLDQEEGGRLLPEQNAYLFSWVDELTSEGFRPGVYCSGIPAPDGPGKFIVTADDIKQHEGRRNISFFVYNDACPPSPGCAGAGDPSPPSASGTTFAVVWQFSQSPVRPEYAKACRSTYAKDGFCYPPGQSAQNPVYVDMDSASSADPSAARQ